MLKRTTFKNAFLVVLLLAVVLAGGACLPYGYYHSYVAPSPLPFYDLKNASYEDRDVLFSIKPMPDEADANMPYPYTDERIRYFLLSVQNKTSRDITIDWSKVYFINKDGQPDGGFMLEGESYSMRHAPKQPLLILANSIRTVKIYPNAKIGYTRDWQHYVIGDGIFGVYAIFDVEGQEKRVKVTVYIGPSE